jgi:hypothetical protein
MPKARSEHWVVRWSSNCIVTGPVSKGVMVLLLPSIYTTDFQAYKAESVSGKADAIIVHGFYNGQSFDRGLLGCGAVWSCSW